MISYKTEKTPYNLWKANYLTLNIFKCRSVCYGFNSLYGEKVIELKIVDYLFYKELYW